MNHVVARVAVVASLLVALTGCGTPTSDAGASEKTPASTSSATAEPAPVAEPHQYEPEMGTIGTIDTATAVAGSEWTVSFAKANYDGASVLIPEGQDNFDPRSMVLAEVKFTSDKELPAGTTLGSQLTIEYFNWPGDYYGGVDDTCGVIPNDFAQISSLDEKHTATGNVCVMVESDEAVGGMWVVTPAGGNPVFFESR
jgi:hypothetical protein